MGNGYRVGKCTFCGSEGYVTDDHIPPKCLFSKPRPSNLVTVPACSDCNTQKSSKDDEYFRLTFGMDEKSIGNPDREGILQALHTSLGRERAEGLRRLVAAETRQVFRRRPSGLIAPAHLRTPNVARLTRTASKITQGLFFRHKGYRIPDQYEPRPVLTMDIINNRKQNPAGFRFMFDKVEELMLTTRPCEMGTAFHYWWKTAQVGPHVTYWLYQIYGRYAFFVVTMPKETFNPVPPRDRTDFRLLDLPDARWASPASSPPRGP